MDRVRAIQIIALKEVLSKNQSAEFQLRSVSRWYSKTFHTPLHVVETLPEFDVLQAYFEDQYEDLNSSNEGQAQIQKLLEDLAKTDEELELEAKRQDEDDVWAYKEEKIAKASESSNDSATLAKNKKKAKEKLDRDRKAAKELEKLQDKDALGAKFEPEKAEVAPINDIPDFEMNFDGLDLGDFADLDANSTLTGVK